MKILVVDDEASIRDLIESIMSYQGNTTRTATSGWEALGFATKQLYDVVITDCQMPNISGQDFFHVLTYLRPEYENRFVFMSAENRNEIKLPPDAIFVEKPFRIEALKDAVKKSYKALHSEEEK